MKKIIIAIVCTAIFSSATTALAVSKQQDKQTALLIAYSIYYQKAEAFFDELDEDTGGLVLEAGSDVGCEYWDAKLMIEQLTK